MATTETEYLLSGTATRLQPAINLHSQNFDHDPMLRFMFNHFPEPQRHAFLREHFFPKVLQIGALGGGIFDEAYTAENPSEESTAPSSGIMWLPPGAKLADFGMFVRVRIHTMLWMMGLGAVKRVLWDYQRVVDQCKAELARWPDGRKVQEYYYMAWVSTVEEARGRGLTGELIRRFQERAGREGRPIWSEASTERALRVYRKCGFEVVKELVFGRGKFDTEGYRAKGGEGVKTWLILWLPPKSEDK